MGYPTDQDFEEARRNRAPPAQQTGETPTMALVRENDVLIERVRFLEALLDSPPRHRAIRAVVEERARQEQLREEGRFAFTCAGPGLDDKAKLAVLVEEVGEVARCVLEQSGAANDKHGKDLKKELIQVAAVAVAWAESFR